MSIKQLHATYFPNEDRIMLRMNTVDQSEYKFWLTRRVTRHILKTSADLFEKDHTEKAKIQKAAGEKVQSAQSVISELKESNDQVQFGEAFESGANYPIGVDPILIMDAKCSVIKHQDQDVFSLDLILPGGGNVNLKLIIPIMKKIILLIEEANTKAGWGSC